MASAVPVALIFGAGANVGANVIKAFAAKGYKIGVVARSAKEADNTADRVNIPGDLSDPSSVVNAFSKVKEALGIPSVVVYNAASAHPNDPKNPLAVKVDDFAKALVINTTSAYVAAQQAALGFEELPKTASRTFIYTGNCTNVIPFPQYLDLGVGKTATAHFLQLAALAYKEKGYKFYYADERTPEGGAVYSQIDGDAHAKLYVELSEGESQGPWQQTFVKGIGYKAF